MTEVRIEEKPSFCIAGRKTWISGLNNEQFILSGSNPNQLGSSLPCWKRRAVSLSV